MADDIRANRWVFTKNNPTEDWEAVALDFLSSPRVLTAVAEREHINEGEGTPHIQGFLSLDKCYHRSTVSTWLPECFLEPAKGGWKQNWRYCTKEGPDHLFFEKGHHLNEQDEAKHNNEKFMLLYNQMKEMTPAQFEEENPQFMFYHRSKILQVMIDHANVQMTWNGNLPDKNFWVWGETGTGKTQWAYLQSENHHMFRKPVSKWWDGFDRWRNDIVLVDEWPAVNTGREGLSDAMCNLLKNWSDRYSFTGEVKGGTIQIEPGKFILIVTSQYPIEDCFTNASDVAALKRRFHIIHFKFARDPENGMIDGRQFNERGELIEQMISINWDVLK